MKEKIDITDFASLPHEPCVQKNRTIYVPSHRQSMTLDLSKLDSRGKDQLERQITNAYGKLLWCGQIPCYIVGSSFYNGLLPQVEVQYLIPLTVEDNPPKLRDLLNITVTVDMLNLENPTPAVKGDK